MALVSCPDCGKDVSDAAPACPNCGRPIADVPSPPSNPCRICAKRGVSSELVVTRLVCPTCDSARDSSDDSQPCRICAKKGRTVKLKPTRYRCPTCGGQRGTKSGSGAAAGIFIALVILGFTIGGLSLCLNNAASPGSMQDDQAQRKARFRACTERKQVLIDACEGECGSSSQYDACLSGCSERRFNKKIPRCSPLLRGEPEGEF
ncbi:MAG: zinc-ribbon domain-containing protein [Deltaproteobacteria bacterium]|nr:zinc-ribbon domain-containing protein [Deltaproteobacteria bacterium]